jgi:integrase
MGHKFSKGSVSITENKGRIRLRRRHQQKRDTLNLSIWHLLNLLQAKKTALQIEQDITTENFDSSQKTELRDQFEPEFPGDIETN